MAGQNAMWKRSTFDVIIPKSLSEKQLNQLSMFYFAGHVPFPCWDTNGVMLLRAQRPEDSTIVSIGVFLTRALLTLDTGY